MTFGDGFDLCERNQNIYPSLVSTAFMLDYENLSVSGASNHMIFMQCADAIRSKEYDIVFCQWTALNRLWLYPGPDTRYCVTGDRKDSYEYRDIHLDSASKIKLESQIKILNHDYQNIIELINYVQILEDLASLHKTKIVHINGMVPWQSDLISGPLSSYTKEILDFDSRNDKEIQALLRPLQIKFAGVNQAHWVNLFDSFQCNMIDLGPQGHHPGPKSHRAMAEKIYNYLQGTL